MTPNPSTIAEAVIWAAEDSARRERCKAEETAAEREERETAALRLKWLRARAEREARP